MTELGLGLELEPSDFLYKYPLQHPSQVPVMHNNGINKIREKKTFLNNILPRKANWIGHILRRNCIFHDVTRDR